MKINIHAGHAKDGNSYSGAVGYVKESVENRKIKDSIIKYLKMHGDTVYDCTVDSGTSATGILAKICLKCNVHSVNIDISIHLNAADKDSADGKTKGIECWCYSESSNTAKEIGARICRNVSELGFTNRGVKFNKGYYVLRKTKSQALIVECLFCDDEDDTNLYNKVGYDAMGKAIAEAIVNSVIDTNYLVRITAKSLNVRDGAGTIYKVNTIVTKGEVFTITETVNNNGTVWGKLLSGAGWISLAYTERV